MHRRPRQGGCTYELRPAEVADLETLYQLTRRAIGPYVEKTWGEWDDELQRLRFDEVTRPEDHQVIVLRGESIGCLCLEQHVHELRLMRLFIDPEYQNRGIGTSILGQLMGRARRLGLPIRLRVLHVNPARRLYERLGFEIVGRDTHHYVMEYAPP